ncbi:MAG: hypothetical protein KGD68_01545 [Candidatus Lokiarchaeota archaeon]|nr:hypothetical protein [Candidatus Lokiarchaeota archaeon]
MKEEISKLLKIGFLVHFFVSAIFGLIFLVVVESYVIITSWPYLDPVTGRILGAVFIGLAVASLLAWRETKWAHVKIIVQMEIVWLAIGTVVHIWAGIMFPVPLIIIWLQTALLIFFLVAFSWFYYDQEMAD